MTPWVLSVVLREKREVKLKSVVSLRALREEMTSRHARICTV